MKGILLISLVFWLSAPSEAEVLVYNSKNSMFEFNYKSDQWRMKKGNETGYTVVDTDVNKANIWEVMTQQRRINGRIRKFADVNYVGEFDFINVPIERKQIWIISGTTDSGERDFLMGKAKPTKVGDTISLIAAKLTGTSIWDQTDGNNRSIGSSKVSLRLDTKLSASVQGHSPEAATEEIVD